jgi:Fe-S cluster assembly protein SufD
MFYLQSRGLPRDKARDLLVYAFANEVMDGIKVRDVRDDLEAVLLASRGLPRNINEDFR